MKTAHSIALKAASALFLCVGISISTYNGACAQQGKWIKVDSVYSVGFLKIVCADEEHCMALGNGWPDVTVVRKTMDGGKTWRTAYESREKPNPFTYADRLNDIAYPTPDMCIIASDSGNIIRTTDGGESWSKLHVAGNARLFNIAMLGKEKSGVMLNGNIGATQYFRTADGGLTWQPSDIPKPPNMASPGLERMVYPMPFVLIGVVHDYNTPNYAIVKTTDDGKTWQIYQAPTGIGKSLVFLDENTGWSVGYGGEVADHRREVIYHTVNGGKTWQTQLDTLDQARNNFGLEAIDFTDDMNGLAVGSVGTIFRTSDGGQNWRREAPELGYNNGPQFRSVAFWTLGTQIALDAYNGTIYRYDISSAVDQEEGAGDHAAIRVYPNPLHGGNAATLSFTLGTRANVRATLLNTVGQELGTMADGMMDPGPQTIHWTPQTALPCGAYFMRLSINGTVSAVPFIVTR